MRVNNFFDEEMKASDGLKSRLGSINADAIVRTLDAHKMSMFGSLSEPVSENIRAMVTYIGPKKSQVMMVLSDGQLVLYGTDDNLPPKQSYHHYMRMTNEDLIEISDAHIRNLRNGGDGHLLFSDNSQPEFPITGLNHFSSAYTKGVDGFTSLCHSWMLEKLDCPSFHDKKVIGSMLTLRSMIRKRLGACRKTILNALDEDVRQAMYRNLESSTQLLSRLTGADKMRYREDAARRKEEAMKLVNQYPAFTGMLLIPDGHTLREIDEYGNMRRGIALDTGLDEVQIRTFKGKTVQSLINIQGSKRGHRLSDILNRSPKQITPWLCYRDYSADDLRTFPAKLLVHVDAFCNQSFGGKLTPKDLAKLKRSVLREAWKNDEIAAFISDKGRISFIADTMNFLYRDVISPMCEEHHYFERYKLGKFMFPDTMRRMIVCSDIYHDPARFSRQNFNQLMRVGEQHVEWDTFIGTFEHEGIVCRELNSRESLISQGEKEGHCVGGYTSSVLDVSDGYINLIFSIEKDDEILSTLSVFLYKSGRIEISQHYAKHNTSPSEEAVRAVSQLIKHLDNHDEEWYDKYVKGIKETSKNFADTQWGVNKAGLREAWPIYRGLLSKRAMRMPGLLACVEEAQKS